MGACILGSADSDVKIKFAPTRTCVVEWRLFVFQSKCCKQFSNLPALILDVRLPEFHSCHNNAYKITRACSVCRSFFRWSMFQTSGQKMLHQRMLSKDVRKCTRNLSPADCHEHVQLCGVVPTTRHETYWTCYECFRSTLCEAHCHPLLHQNRTAAPKTIKEAFITLVFRWGATLLSSESFSMCRWTNDLLIWHTDKFKVRAIAEALLCKMRVPTWLPNACHPRTCGKELGTFAPWFSPIKCFVSALNNKFTVVGSVRAMTSKTVKRWRNSKRSYWLK